MICRVAGGEHKSRRADAQRCDLRGNRLAMVDDVMGAEILDPAHRFGARGGCHYGEIGERADELDRDRADPASAADDENRGGRARHRLHLVTVDGTGRRPVGIDMQWGARSRRHEKHGGGSRNSAVAQSCCKPRELSSPL